MDVDLFAPNASHEPRPAWQVIDAARRQYVTGELLLDTSPPTRVYLRDGQVYFAERTTDGGLGVRLLVEGVITREQMHKGTLQVSGVEHLGRLFERDTTIDRDAVQLCVELMTDDVLTEVADDIVRDVRMAMYKRHPSGIDRWLPTRVEVITHVVSSVDFVDPDSSVAQGRPPRPTAHLSPGPLDTPVAVPPAVAAAPAPPPVAAPEPAPIMAAPAPEPVEAPPAEPTTLPPAAVPPAPSFAFTPMSASDMPTGILPVIDPVLDVDHSPASADEAPPEPEVSAAEPTTGEVTLAPEAMHAIMSTGIADEVADAVRRALAAIDATPL